MIRLLQASINYEARKAMNGKWGTKPIDAMADATRVQAMANATGEPLPIATQLVGIQASYDESLRQIRARYIIAVARASGAAAVLEHLAQQDCELLDLAADLAEADAESQHAASIIRCAMLGLLETAVNFPAPRYVVQGEFYLHTFAVPNGTPGRLQAFVAAIQEQVYDQGGTAGEFNIIDGTDADDTARRIHP